MKRVAFHGDDHVDVHFWPFFHDEISRHSVAGFLGLCGYN